MSEKLRILKMLENGQISATDAAQLLQAVDGGGATPPTPAPFSPPPASFSPPPPTHHHAPPPPPRPTTGRYEGYAPNNSGRPTPPPSTHSSMDDLGRKFESFARDMAPKAQKFMENIADKIDGAASKISSEFTGSRPAYPIPPHGQAHRPHTAPRPSAPTPGGTVEKSIEMPVETGGYNELSLAGINGEIRIKGYNGDKITARLVYRASKASAAHIEMVKLGGKYFLKYEPDDFQLVSIDAFVPERAFSVIKVDGVNCQLDCASLAANEMRFSNANGTTRLTGLSASNIVAESSGGNFSVSNISAASATIENLNGTMDTDELDIANLKLSNYNSPLSIIMSKFARHEEYIWSVETGNAKLSINLPTMPDLGYHIKAHAAMSQIKLGLTGLQFLINEPSLVEARSIHFDTAVKKIKMAVETSNAPLVIN
ncbi:MAG: hypothetical protein FWE05_09270 [Defluviitaleaceae bacterium]|nr:hypothetical protein [Defluviitaleaceae bacterium]